MTNCKCLPPLIKNSTTILILGTMPGIDSINSSEYYSNKNNLMWDILYRTLNIPWPCHKLVDEKYAAKKLLLIKHKIGFWDVLESGIRTNGSRDKFEEYTINEFNSIINSKSKIKHIIFNSKSPLKYWKERYGNDFLGMDHHVLPSTSSMNPTNAFKVFQVWKSKIDDLVISCENKNAF